MGKEITSAAQDYGMDHIRKSHTYHSLCHVCEWSDQSIACEQQSSFFLTLHLFNLWAKGSKSTQFLAAVENSISD